jgi:hypothetical protein
MKTYKWSLAIKGKKPTTDDLTHQPVTNGQHEPSQKKHLPYHGVLQRHLLPNTHLLRSMTPIY